MNIAADHNQLVMECMKRVADRHGMVCLLHEKPFAGVNGSGKHNNWSLSTDRGENLLNPGDTPEENAQFLLILTAVLQAVDEYQDLLRISVAGASNDHRLGGSEAPPAILSVFLGDEITGILDSIENGTPYESGEKVQFKVGVHVLPRFPKDTSDRNRTSPFAFTGNKFEFRMVGSSQSISEANIILNTAVADVLRRYADELEGTADFESALHELIKRSIREHRRIIFNGNGYEEAWVREAARRGLCNYRSTPDCVPHLLDAKKRGAFPPQPRVQRNGASRPVRDRARPLRQGGAHRGAHAARYAAQGCAPRGEPLYRRSFRHGARKEKSSAARVPAGMKKRRRRSSPRARRSSGTARKNWKRRCAALTTDASPPNPPWRSAAARYCRKWRSCAKFPTARSSSWTVPRGRIRLMVRSLPAYIKI